MLMTQPDFIDFEMHYTTDKKDENSKEMEDKKELQLVKQQEKARGFIQKLEEKNKHALEQIDEAIDSADRNLMQGDLGFILAQNKQNGLKMGIESLSKNFNQIELNMQQIG